MTDEINSLIQRYVDDRDDLSDAELEELTRQLRESESLRGRLRDQLVIHELIAQQVAFDRRDFPAQVDQRLRDEKSEEQLESQVKDMQSLAAEQWDQWSVQADRRKRRTWIRMAVAASLILCATLGGYASFETWGPIGEFKSVQGQVMLVRDGLQVNAQPGMWLYPGDEVRSTEVAHWTMRYPDASVLTGRGLGRLNLAGRRWDAKQINVASGDFSADAQPQPFGKPMRFTSSTGEATVVGTELHLLVNDVSTRLDVEHGKVQFRDVASNDEQLVVTGSFATAAGGDLSGGLSAWPMSRSGLVIDTRFAQGEVANVRLDSQIQEAELIPRGDASVKKQRLVLDGGACQLAPFAADEVFRRCQDANAFTVELWFRNGDEIQPAKSHLLAFGPDAATNLAITAEKGGLFLQFGFAGNTSPSASPIRLCTLDSNWRHVAVSYNHGVISTFVDGRHSQTITLKGDLSPWKTGYFMIGDQWQGDGSSAWVGEIGAVAVYDRPLTVHEAFRNWRQLRSPRVR